MNDTKHSDFDAAAKTAPKPYQAPKLRDLDDMDQTEAKAFNAVETGGTFVGPAS